MAGFETWQPPLLENGKLTKWNWMIHHPQNIILKPNTSIGAFTYINAKHEVEIQEQVQIDSHCSIYSYHTLQDTEQKGKVLIKKNAYIGSHCTIMPGVIIGENAIIEPYSCVNTNIPDNSIASGNPAKIKLEIKTEIKKLTPVFSEKHLEQTSQESQDQKSQNQKNPWKISLFKTYSDEADVEAVAKVLRRGTYWALGPEIEQFEQAIAKLVNTKFALAFNSGTSALHSLLLAYNIKDREVIIPSFTFIATANAVVLAGGIPIFAESEPDTFGLDAQDVESRITPKTIAIIPLHYGGFPSRDIEKLRAIADKHNLFLIDDAAESLGSKINNKPIGSYGHAAMFSFCQNKVLATGEGGIIVTDSQEIYEKSKLIRSHGRVEETQDYFSHVGDNDYIQVGYNFRMPTIIAALGLSQLEKMPLVINLRRKHAKFITEKLSHIKELHLPTELPNHYSVYQMYTLTLPNKILRDQLQTYLTQKQIMSKVYFNPVHLKTIYRKAYQYKQGDLPKTESLSDRVLNIPLYPSLSSEELEYLTHSIQEFFATEK